MNRKEFEQRKRNKTSKPTRQTKKEFNKSLNFMINHGIISHKEYNELLIKSLPYLKG